MYVVHEHICSQRKAVLFVPGFYGNFIKFENTYGMKWKNKQPARHTCVHIRSTNYAFV